MRWGRGVSAFFGVGCCEGGGKCYEGGGREGEERVGEVRFGMRGGVSRFLRGLESVVGTRVLGMRVMMKRKLKRKRRFVVRRWCGRGGCCIRRCPR